MMLVLLALAASVSAAETDLRCGAEVAEEFSALQISLRDARDAEADEDEIWGQQQASIETRLTSELFGLSRARAPELAKWYDLLDQRMQSLVSPDWNSTTCLTGAHRLLKYDNAKHVTKGGQLIFHAAWYLGVPPNPTQQDMDRKLRLTPSSYLATQDKNSQMIFWIDVPSDHPRVQELFGEMLSRPDIAARFSVRQFDPDTEFSKIALNDTLKAALKQLYVENPVLASKSDILRAVAMHNYGGMWVDTDMIMIQDFRPLAGVDWAYLGQLNWINNAALSVSEPRSSFSKSYLAAMVLQAAGNMGQYLAFGPDLLGTLFNEMTPESKFYVLPTCLFDGYWGMGDGNAPDWDYFFSKVAPPDQNAYLAPHSADQDAFSYHWHNRWNEAIVDGSAADVLEHTYRVMLGL